MNEMFYIGLAVIALAFGLAIGAILTYRVNQRVDMMEKLLGYVSDMQVKGFTATSSGLKSQDKVNRMLFELVTAHHIALRLPTGIADEISNYLKNQEGEKNG